MNCVYNEIVFTVMSFFESFIFIYLQTITAGTDTLSFPHLYFFCCERQSVVRLCPTSTWNLKIMAIAFVSFFNMLVYLMLQTIVSVSNLARFYYAFMRSFEKKKASWKVIINISYYFLEFFRKGVENHSCHFHTHCQVVFT